MARDQYDGELVPWSDRFNVVPDGPELIHPSSEPERPKRQRVDLPECDTVSDQADGARGPEEDISLSAFLRNATKKACENGRVSSRRGTERGN